MASTITRTAWTDDTGTAAAPNGDGTLLNNAAKTALYDQIDQLIGGGAGYTTLTFGGAIATEASGTAATFNGAPTGGQLVDIRHTASGTGNFAGLRLGNDNAAGNGLLLLTATNYTTSNHYVQDSVILESKRTGGISIAATNASGDIRFYTGGNVAKAKLLDDGALELVSQAAHPTSLVTDTNWQIYVKEDKIVLQWNEASTRYYYYLTGGQSGGTWTQTTSAP